jgi:glutamate racemase
VIGFLHTAAVHVQTFAALLDAVDSSLPSRHSVDAALLDEARAAGGVTPAIAARIGAAVRELASDGAVVVLCTCSTIGAAAETTTVPSGVTVMRVDRPMAEHAIALGRRVAVVAALASTLAPTTELLRDAARRAGRTIEVFAVPCADAWPHFERGDMTAYLDAVGHAIDRGAATADVVVLAQASMAAAAERAAPRRVPVLSSPRLGVEAAVRAYRQQRCPTSV